MATGSSAMPSKEPAPLSGTAEQAEPKGLSAEAPLPEPVMPSSDAEADADAFVFDEESEEAESPPLSEQALRVSGRTAAAATVTAMRRREVFKVLLLCVTAACGCLLRKGKVVLGGGAGVSRR
ncbi:hypothetical protein GCM10027075_27870 [Streptomyces heilongjiangensis]